MSIIFKNLHISNFQSLGNMEEDGQLKFKSCQQKIKLDVFKGKLNLIQLKVYF